MSFGNRIAGWVVSDAGRTVLHIAQTHAEELYGAIYSSAVAVRLHATQEMATAAPYYGLLLSLIISALTYAGSVRHMRRMNQELKEHISDRTAVFRPWDR